MAASVVPTITTNSDRSADFAGLQPLSTDIGNVRSLLSSQMIVATTNEVETLGWRRDANIPDVLINSLVETSSRFGHGQAARAGVCAAGAVAGCGGCTMSTPTIEQTTKGALSIDMLDPVRNQLIW